jgi:hypothetical protein
MRLRTKWASVLQIALLVFLVVGLFRAGIEKNLVETITEQEWGRYLFGIGAALTYSRWHIGGYVVDQAIEQKLQSKGLTDDRRLLQTLNLKFPNNLADKKLLQGALDDARQFNASSPVSRDDQRLRGSHGDDVGVAVLTTLSFRLFGLKLASLYYFYFLVLSLTLVLFALAHYQRPASMACAAIMLLAVYMIAVSDVCGFVRTLPPYAGSGGSDFKDPRFFGTIAAFPALHVLALWMRSKYPMDLTNYLILIAQATIFAFAVQVRWPELWVLGALCGYWLIREVSGQTLWLARSASSLFVPSVFALIVALGTLGIALTASPVYREDGDLQHHPFWHNMMTALEGNPEWDTKYLSTVDGARQDDMPLEIARQEIAKLPANERSRYLMRMNWPSPSAVMHFARIRFLEIAQNDPWFVASTFLLYQPRAILKRLSEFYRELFVIMTPTLAGQIVAAVLIILWTARSDPEARLFFAKLLPAAAIFAIASLLPPLIVAPVHPLIMIDCFLWSLFFVGAVLCFAFTRLRWETIRAEQYDQISDPSYWPS